MPSAIARIESYKHYQASAIHKEAVRELFGYKNPNWVPSRTPDNVYFERMSIEKPFEQWIYEFREQNNIVGRYIEHSKNPKSETNAMCQAFFTVPGYIDNLPRDEQIELLRHCYNFFKSEFDGVPVLEACCHFDETSPHLQINFLPVVSREHKKRGTEQIFSTTLLMPGKDFFPNFQDRFYQYMESVLDMDLERQKGGKAKHLAPKEYRELTSEIQALKSEKKQLEESVEVAKVDYQFFSQQLSILQAEKSLDSRIRMAKEIAKLQSFLSYVFKKIPYFYHVFEDWRRRYDLERSITFTPVAYKLKKDYDPNTAYIGRMDWKLQSELDRIFGTNFAEEDKKRYFERKKGLSDIDK